MQIFVLNVYFSHTNCRTFLKINRVEGIDEIDKFHENPTKNEDFIAKTRKRLTDGRMNRWTDRPTDGRRKPRHDISSAGF